MQQNPTTTAELLEAAKVAEATIVDSGPPVSSEILEPDQPSGATRRRASGQHMSRRHSSSVTRTVRPFFINIKILIWQSSSATAIQRVL